MNSLQIIELFEKNEQNVAILYSIYAEKIPEKRSFWNNLATEEASHADYISNNKELKTTIVENRYLRDIIKYIMDFVLQEIIKAKTSRITHQEALNTALRLEHSMLEKKCFEMFSSANDGLMRIFHKLNSETENHVKMITEEMYRNNFSIEEDNE
jgi:hypothetical protein